MTLRLHNEAELVKLLASRTNLKLNKNRHTSDPVTEASWDVPMVCAKPRMTRRDTWAKRPAVLRYHAFKDEVRATAPAIPTDIGELSVIATIKMPDSWSKTKKGQMLGKYHRQKPDSDNIIKAVGDALMSDDSGLYTVSCTKIWGLSDNTHIIVRSAKSSNGLL